MKFKSIVFALAIASAPMSVMAQGGYQDGVDYYNADRFEQAKIILNKTLNESGTDKSQAYYYLGCIDMREGNTAGAKANFEKGLAAGDFALNNVGLGEIALKSGDKGTAKNYFQTAEKLGKKDPEVSAAIARAYFNVDPVAYAKDIDKYVAKGLKDSKNLGASIYVLQGDMAAKKDIGQAAGYYEQAMIYDEQAGNINPEAYVKYANLYNNTTEKTNKKYAISKLEELKSKLPNSALALRELAEKYYDAEQYSKAAQVYKEYMSNPNHFQQDEQRLCQLLYFDNKNDESLAIAKNILKNDPSNHYMYRMVMLNDVALKNYTEAAEYGAKLFGAKDVTLTSMDYNTYAEALENLGRNDEAVKIYESGYNANPGKNKEMLATISALYSDLKDYPKAAEYQQKYVDLGGASLNDLFTLANRYRNLALSQPEGSAERTESAKKGLVYIDHALETAATKAPLYRNRAVLLQLRDGQKATEELVDTYKNLINALDENPENKTTQADLYKSAYATIGSYYYTAGDKANAKVYYQKLYEIAPDTPGLGDMIKKL